MGSFLGYAAYYLVRKNLSLAAPGMIEDGLVDKAGVGVEDRLGEACRAGGEIDGTVILIGDRYAGRVRGAVGDHAVIAVRKGRAVLAYVEEMADARDAIADLFDASDKLRTKEKYRNICKVKTVVNFI